MREVQVGFQSGKIILRTGSTVQSLLCLRQLVLVKNTQIKKLLCPMRSEGWFPGGKPAFKIPGFGVRVWVVLFCSMNFHRCL